MPRKVDPKWGDDGFHDVDPFCLNPGQVEDLAEVLGMMPRSPQIAEIRSTVEYIGTQYWNWCGRGPVAFTRAEARKSLEDLLDTKDIDYAALNTLNGRAFDCVFNALLMMKPPPVAPADTVFLALSEDRLDQETLRMAMHTAIAELKAQKGPDRTGEVAWAVEQLCRHFEVVTGQKATLSNKGTHMGYEQSPQSSAGGFVLACFRLIDPKVTGAQVSRAMRHFITRRR